MAKTEGKTFNVKEKVINADETTTWKMHGRVFLRADLSGGAVWLAEAGDEKEYALFPKEGTTKSGGKSFEVGEEGTEERLGRVFVRADLSGGAYWVGVGDAEKEYALFPKDGKAKGAAQHLRPGTPASQS